MNDLNLSTHLKVQSHELFSIQSDPLSQNTSIEDFLLNLNKEVENRAASGEVLYSITNEKCEQISIERIVDYFEFLGFSVIKDSDFCVISWMDCVHGTYAAELAFQNRIRRIFKLNLFNLGTKPSDFELISDPISTPFYCNEFSFEKEVKETTDYFLNYIKSNKSEHFYKYVVDLTYNVPNSKNKTVLKKTAENLELSGFETELNDLGNIKTMTISWDKCMKKDSLAWKKQQESKKRELEAVQEYYIAKKKQDQKKSWLKKLLSFFPS